ncbi:MAG: transcriptional repressor LexA [Patescibacteria group bacterium]|nr:transcriptional repressor LexA [Patescibacteria group bacterium]
MKNLTKKQKKILDYLANYEQDNGYMPSYQEITKEMGLKSKATIWEHLKNLKDKGYLDFVKGAARAIKLEEKFRLFAKAVQVPLVGLIAAGEPIEAIEDKEMMDVPIGFVNGKRVEDCFALKVRGDSMIEDGILDGDYVMVEKNYYPNNGDVVVALLGNEYATLKRYYREKKRIRLQPANSTMKPIYAVNPAIQGVVRAVLRKF